MKATIIRTGLILAVLAITAFGAEQKMTLPRNRQDDGQMLLRDEGRQVLLPVHQKNLRPVLLRYEVRTSF